MIKRKQFTWYLFDKILSFNAIWNLIVTSRGEGKSYGAKKLVLRKALLASLENYEQFMYARRYTEELLEAKSTFMDDIIEEFPEWDFKMGKSQLLASPKADAMLKKKDREWRLIGHFVALSTSHYLKSKPFPRVTTIIIDEFILEPGSGQYLKNEARVILNLFNTVDRNQGKTRVLALANSVSIVCPLFMEWDIVPPNDGSEWVKRKKNTVIAHFPHSEEYKKEIYQTAFGELVQGTAYGDYAVGNEFADNHGNLLAVKGSRYACQYLLESEYGIYSIWYSTRDMKYHVHDTKLPPDVPVFTLLSAKMAEGKTLIELSSPVMSYLRTAYRNANVTFENAKTRESIRGAFKFK